MDEEEEGRSPRDGSYAKGGGNTALSPIPPKPVNDRHDRRSLDGETIFAIGEEGDKWSEDEDDSVRKSQERKRLASTR